MGVAAWYMKDLLSLRLGRISTLGAIGSLIGLEIIGGQRLFLHANTPLLPPGFSAYDYVVGIIVAVLICGIATARLPMPGQKLTKAAHTLAGTTFGLYLFHYPLLRFFGSVIPGEPTSVMHRILLFSFTLGISLILAIFIEQRKNTFKHLLRSALSLVVDNNLQIEIIIYNADERTVYATLSPAAATRRAGQLLVAGVRRR